MAIEIQTSAYLTRVGSYLTPGSDWTVFFKYNMGTSTPPGSNWRQPFVWGDPTLATAYIYIGSSASGMNDLVLNIYDGAASHVTTAVGFQPSQWNWVAATYSSGSTTASFYFNGTLIGTVIENISGISFGSTTDQVGSSTAWGDYGISNLREWQAALSLSQLSAESLSNSAVHTSNLLTDSPLSVAFNVTDKSGNSHSLAAHGTITQFLNPVPLPSSANQWMIRQIAVKPRAEETS